MGKLKAGFSLGSSLPPCRTAKRARGVAAVSLVWFAAVQGSAGAVAAAPKAFPGCAATTASAQNLSGCDLRKVHLPADLSGKNLSKANLSGQSFQQSNLANVDLRGANLANVFFSESNLANVDFRGANLSGASISLSNPTNADFRGANLTRLTFTGGSNINGAQFDGATIRGLTSDGLVTGTPAGAPPFRLVKGFIIGPGANLQGAPGQPIDFSGLDLKGVDFTDVGVGDIDLSNADLTGDSLRGFPSQASSDAKVTITGTKLADADLDGINGLQFTGVPASLPANWVMSHLNYADGQNTYDIWFLHGPGVRGVGSLISSFLRPSGRLDLLYAMKGDDWHGADFSDLSGSGPATVDLSGWDLSDANFSGASLDGVDFSAANLSGANLSRATMTEGTFYDSVNDKTVGTPATKLRDANLAGANLTEAQVGGADFGSVDLSLTQLARIDGGDGVVGTPSAMPPGWKFVSKRFIGKGVMIMSGSFKGSDFTGMDLRGTMWMGVNLDSADFTRANLTGAEIFNSTLAHAKFERAALTNLRSGGNTGQPAKLPAGYIALGGGLLGPRVVFGSCGEGGRIPNALERKDLTGINLSGASLNCLNLKRTNLTRANLTGTDLRSCNLTGVISSRIVGSPRLPFGWIVRRGVLVKK